MTGDVDPDAQLMLRVKDGDIEAFESLVDRYKQPVINLIYRSLPDLAEAEDLAQNVFIQVHRSAARYQASAKFSTWLFTIARNLCLNEIRRRSRHPTEPIDHLPGAPEDAPERQLPELRTAAPPEALLQDELESLVQRALADLPENQRTALVLYQQQELSYDEISAVLDCSLSATKSLIFRARETLKRRLKPYLRTGSWEPADSPASQL